MTCHMRVIPECLRREKSSLYEGAGFIALARKRLDDLAPNCEASDIYDILADIQQATELIKFVEFSLRMEVREIEIREDMMHEVIEERAREVQEAMDGANLEAALEETEEGE